MDTDTETVLAEAFPLRAERRADNKVPDAGTDIRHFSCYGKVSGDDVAAFAAVKVLLERAFAAERETHRRTTSLGVDPRRRGYVVRLITNDGTRTSPIDADLDPEASLLGTMSVEHLDHSAYSGFDNEADARRSVVVRVRPAQSRHVDRPVPARLAGRMRGTFEFTVVNGHVTHCVWMRRQ
jgi:hypothetical protein